MPQWNITVFFVGGECLGKNVHANTYLDVVRQMLDFPQDSNVERVQIERVQEADYSSN